LTQFVLDSYALLEWLLGQPKADMVRRYLEDSAAGKSTLVMSWINIGEVSYMLARKRGAEKAAEFLERLPSLPIRLVLPDVPAILDAARIKAQARLSYADAFAVGLALSLNGSLVTGDPEIRDFRLVPVEWIGAGET